jgi:hypothetical protein
LKIPIIVFHIKKNYSPFVSEETKELNLNRKALQGRSSKNQMQGTLEGI